MAFWIANANDEGWRTWILERLSSEFKDRRIAINNKKGSWQSGRYIKLASSIPNWNVHYEYSDGWVYFHVEDQKLRDNVLKYIRTNSKIRNKSDELEWGNHCNVVNGRCWLKNFSINNIDQLILAFKKISEFFDPLLLEATKRYAAFNRNVEYSLPDGFVFKDLTNEHLNEAVKCTTKKLRDTFHGNLKIPDYQRDYCWGQSEIMTLVNSLSEINNNEPYHLGTIILHEKEGEYNIIDGQQRLTTLTLFLRELGYEDAMPLLKQKFMSRQSVEHVSYAKYILQSLVQRLKVDLSEYANRLADNITFSILILTEENLDLAYTFFSNQNSKGVPLSDFDLLKAHHLRYIQTDAQAEHHAIAWNILVNDGNDITSINLLQQSLGTHIYRLRHWLRKHSPDESKERRVKQEYVAAPIMRSISPFGEKFVYNDKIQGGSHFFAYASNFVTHFSSFIKIKQASLLRQYLYGNSHSKYRDVIETLLFAYYLKFNKQYISEALFCITSVMADHRYSNGRAIAYKIKKHACDSELLLMIEQASSPTFFLAEALTAIKYSGLDLEEADIKNDFYNQLRSIFSKMPGITDMDIKQRINEEYQL